MTNPSADLYQLVSVPSEVEAAVIVATLTDGGIQAVAAGGLTSSFRAEAPGEVAVLVNAADAERAHQILQQHRSDEHPVNWSEVDVGEPED